ncbi:MAG: histidine kinase dimerization/phosphoacceptor domain -containing protein, partial [Thermodesulfobacteriota bacterium]
FVLKPVKKVGLVARIDAQMRIREFYHGVEQDKKNLETILDVTKAVSTTLDSHEVLNIVVCKVAEITEATRCSILLVPGGDVGYVLASNDNPNIDDLKIDLTKYPEIQEAIRTKSFLVVDDVATDSIMNNIKNLVNEYQGLSVLVVPIVFGEEVLGTLLLKAQKSGHGFGDKEIELCRVVANASYPAIRNAHIFEEMKEEKEQALNEKIKELAKSERKLAIINENLKAEISVRKGAQAEISRSLKEKDVLLKEIHHRVKNNLQVVSGILQLQLHAANNGNGADIKEVLGDCRNRIKSMAVIHDRLHYDTDLANVDFSDCIQMITRDFIDCYERGDCITVNHKGGKVFLSVDQAIPCSLIVNELITNSFKHAFPDGKKGEINIEVTEEDGAMVVLRVSDNGVGIDSSVNWRNPKSVGLDLLKGLTRQIDGTIELDKSNGTGFEIKFQRR